MEPVTLATLLVKYGPAIAQIAMRLGEGVFKMFSKMSEDEIQKMLDKTVEDMRIQVRWEVGKDGILREVQLG